MWSRCVIVSCLIALASCTARTQPNTLGPPEFYWLLDRACVSGDEMSVQMLLKAGADPTGIQGYEAFHHSTYQIGLEPSWPINQAASGGGDVPSSVERQRRSWLSFYATCAFLSSVGAPTSASSAARS